MKRQTYVHFRNGKLGSGWIKTKQRKSPSAWSGEFLAARAARTIDAFGGPCPIISIHDRASGIGALIHIDGGEAEQDGNGHEALIDALLGGVGEISTDAVVHVFFDPLPYPGLLPPAERKQQRDRRKAYAKRVVDYLESKGFTGAKIVTKGTGKVVSIDTTNRRLWATNDAGETLVDVSFDG